MAVTRSRGAKTDPGSIVSGLAARLGELEHAVGRQQERFAAVIDIGTLISSARDVEDLLSTVMDRLTQLVGADAASLFMYDEGTGELWSRVLKGSALKEIRIPSRAGIAGHAFTTNRTLLLGDAYSDVRFNPDIDRKSGFRTRSMIAAPLRHVSGRSLGVIEVLGREVDAFTSDDRALVDGVASQVAAVLDNVRLLEQLTARNLDLKTATEQLAQRVHDLDVLYEVEQVIGGTQGEVDLVDAVLGKAMDVVSAKAGSVLLVDEEEDSLYFRSARGDRSEGLKATRIPTGKGIAGHVAATGKTVRAGSAEELEFFERSISKKLGVAVGPVLCVPIHTEGRTLGALELLNKKGGFTEADERLAVLLAGQMGRAIVKRQSREEVERKARLANIGQAIAGILHDLRTPLTVVGGYAEMMAEEPDEEQRKEMAATIRAQLEHINAMQSETMAFARGEQNVLIRKVYLNTFMDELGKQLDQEFVRTKVELKLNANYVGTARFDESKMKRAIFNLARNAIDAMPEGGRFTLSLDREGADLVFRAQDNGPGIPEEIADKLFESFVTSGKKHGTGLGLAIVKQIAKEHHGSVSSKSRPGKGATFELRFPAGTTAS